MEKLLGLLNEYEEVKYGRYGEYEFVFDGCIRSRKDAELLNETIISKKFGFIEWLVDNDKIDRDEIIINSDFMPVAFDRKGDKYEWNEEKQLLMLLSIQDEPIEFLVSILKDDATEKIDKLLNGAKKTCENIGI